MHPVRTAYADFLRPLPAQWMWTLTLREFGHPETLQKAFVQAIKVLETTLYGAPVNPKRALGVAWLLGHERHASGEPHAHAIVYAMEDLNALVSRRELWDWWFKERGINKLEPVRSSAQAAAYCTKYVLKDGDVAFSPNFGAFVKFYRDGL